jgi:hypothetical protein
MSSTTKIIIGSCISVFILILICLCVYFTRRQEKNETKAFMDEDPLQAKYNMDDEDITPGRTSLN